MTGRSLVMLLLAGVLAVRAGGSETRFQMLPGEEWRGAATFFGSQMPFDEETSLEIDLRTENYYNQYSSLLLSNLGRVIWCDVQAKFSFTNGTIAIEAEKSPVLTDAGATLRDAYMFASKSYFPPSGRTPDLSFFAAPQYNTWIELTYNQNERDVLAYAQSMLDHGCPPGVLMIDDTWQTAYGDWNFDGRRFPDPKGMVKKLHDQGFKVILWICPWVSMDSPAYRLLTQGIDPFKSGLFPIGGLYRDAKGSVVPVEWWNGISAMLDFTDPRGREWFKGELDRLVGDYDVDGFKLDGGALSKYINLVPFVKGTSTADQSNGFAAFSLQYPVCEYRHAWNYGGKPVVMRLHDKNHVWKDLQSLIPDLIAGGLLGCSFMCPDMVGGGNWVSFLPGSDFDEELFIRSAQVHALCGQMQFSASPWRVLSEKGQTIIRNLVSLRQKRFAAKFVELAKECGKTGEPMIRHMDYMFPGNGYGKISDQFVMGDFLMVAPQVEKGKPSREVAIPPGVWRADDGLVVVGPSRITVSTPIDRLPYFECEKQHEANDVFAQLENPGFESANPTQGWLVPKAWQIEDDGGRSGSHGLVWENADKDHYSFSSCRVSLEPGMTYRFGAWVKVDSLEGQDPKVEVDWSDRSGKWLGGCTAYPTANNDVTSDGWVLYEGFTQPVPSNVGSGCNILGCVPKGGIGCVRFDDFFIEPLGIKWVDHLTSSAYHDEVARSDGKVKFFASLHINTVRCPLADAVAELKYRGVGGVVRTARPQTFTTEAAEFVIDASEFSLGPQELVFRLKKGDEELAEERLRFTCMETSVVRRVMFDREGRLSVGGRRIFPLGMYIRSLDGTRLETYLEGPFNIAVQYGDLSREDLDRYATHGIYVMMDVRGYVDGYSHGTPCLVKSQAESKREFRRLVAEYGDHPALLGWYLVDEAPRKLHQAIADANRFLHEIDPDHPTYAVTDKPKDVRSLLPGFDIIGVDPYPIGNFWRKCEDVSICSTWSEQAREGAFGVRPIWNVPQAFSWEWYRRGRDANGARTRMPSFDELANMIWQSIAAGANGLVLYSFEPLVKQLSGVEFKRVWSDVCRAAQEVRQMEPVLLSETLTSTIGALPDSLVVRSFQLGEAEWVLLVNRSASPVKERLLLKNSFTELSTAVGGGVSLQVENRLDVDFAGLGYAFVELKY